MKNKMKLTIEKAIDYYKQQGSLGSLKRLLEALGFKYFHRSLIFKSRDLNLVPDDFDGKHRLSIATADEIKNENNYNDRWHTKDKAIERLENGDYLFIHRDNGKIVYYSWIYLKEVTIDWFGLRFNIPDDMAYTTGLYTPPEYRRKGIAHAMGPEKRHYMKQAGIRYNISVVAPSNTASIQLAKKRAANIRSNEYQIVDYYRFWFIRYYRVRKWDSEKKKTFICVFKNPADIWKVFLPLDQSTFSYSSLPNISLHGLSNK